MYVIYIDMVKLDGSLAGFPVSKSDSMTDFPGNVIKYDFMAWLSIRAYSWFLLFGEFVMLLIQSITYV